MTLVKNRITYNIHVLSVQSSVGLVGMVGQHAGFVSGWHSSDGLSFQG